MSTGGEKTEKPTPKRRKESRKQGQVARTQELGGWAAMLLAGLALPMLVSREVGSLVELFQHGLGSLDHASPATDLALLGQALRHVFVVLVVLGSGVLVVGVASALAQGGFYVATKSVKPSLAKLNPLKGAKRVFGPQGLWEGAKMLVKSTLVGLLVWAAIRSMMPLLGGLLPMSTVVAEVSDRALGLVRNIALAGLVMAAADYAMARRRVGKQTRMSREEVKQEHKQTEGDPLVRSAIRSRQLAASRNRMMADVPAADVVLVNPTHVAVALRYDAEKGAPRVVARGAGVIATRIREAAAESRVPLVRDVPLARALYRSTQVGQQIPAELFAAVAEVLAYVIRLRSTGGRGGQHRSPRAEGALPPVLPAGRRRRPDAPNASGAHPAGR